LRRTIKGAVNVKNRGIEHRANFGLALALDPEIDDLPIALAVPVKGAKIVHDRRSLRPRIIHPRTFAGAGADIRFKGGRYIRKR
jgi:hypothetical protein